MEPNVLTHLVLRKTAVESDWKLRVQPKEKNNGRKVLVNQIYPAKEIHAQDFEWAPGPPTGKTPVGETGFGGIEVATFTQEAGQDRHKHLLGTEIYTVLNGVMRMRLAEDVVIELKAGDEIIVFPDTVHEVLPEGTEFLTRVHSINCYGDRDKYVEKDGNWCQVLTLKALGRA